MNKTFLIFPHQLYYKNINLKDMDNIYIVEEPRFFTDFKFHKLKLVYHRASMKRYMMHLKKTSNSVHYVE